MDIQSPKNMDKTVLVIPKHHLNMFWQIWIGSDIQLHENPHEGRKHFWDGSLHFYDVVSWKVKRENKFVNDQLVLTHW